MDSGFTTVFHAPGDEGGWGRIYKVRADLFSNRIFFLVSGTSSAHQPTTTGWYEFDLKTGLSRLTHESSSDLHWLDGSPYLINYWSATITNLDTQETTTIPFSPSPSLVFAHQDRFYLMDRNGSIWQFFGTSMVKLRSSITLSTHANPTSFALVGATVLVGYADGSLTKHSL